MKEEKVVIIGSGPAGCTAALYCARFRMEPVLYTGAVPGGMLTKTSTVENFPGFPQGIQGFDLVNAMQEQAERFGARIEYERILRVEFSDGGIQKLFTESGKELHSLCVILATGAQPKKSGLEAEERLAGKGVSYCAVCDGPFYQGKAVVVAGGGDSAMEEALQLSQYASQVILIHRSETFRASSVMQERVLNNPKIRVLRNQVIEEITGSDHVSGVIIRSREDGTVQEIPCRGFFAAFGYEPDTALFKEQLETDERGYIRLFNNTSATSSGGVFAAGDCADPFYRQAVTAAAMGCKAALDARRYCERYRF